MINSAVSQTQLFTSARFRFIVIKKRRRSIITLFGPERNDLDEFSLRPTSNYDISVHWLSNVILVDPYIFSSARLVHIQLHDVPNDMIIALRSKYLSSILGLIKLWRRRRDIKKLVVTTVTDKNLGKFLLMKPTLLYNCIPGDLPKNTKKQFDICVFLSEAKFKGKSEFFKFITKYTSSKLNICIVGIKGNKNDTGHHHLNYYQNIDHKTAIQLISDSKVLLHFSKFEALPSPVIEARAVGIPVFCPKYVTISRLYQNDPFVNFLDQHSSADLNRQIKQFLNPPIVSKFVPPELTFSHFKKQISDIYQYE